MAGRKFEEALERLEAIVQKLESGDLTLEESLKSFEEGTKLATFCNKKLEEAEQMVSVLMKESDGIYEERPFDIEEPETG
jgi:exodeoxyribonuclease VII small subunit